MVGVTPIFPDSSVWSFLPDDGIRSPAGRCLLTSWGVGEALGVPVPVILEFDTMLWWVSLHIVLYVEADELHRRM